MIKILTALLTVCLSLNVYAEEVQYDDLEAQADIEVLIENMEKSVADWSVDDVDRFCSHSFNFNTKDEKGNTVLYYALSRNLDKEVIQKIIKCGADVNMMTKSGLLPINITTSKANEIQLQIFMFQTMGLNLDDPKVKEKIEKDVFRQMSYVTELAAILIDNGADVNKESILGTPLMNASTNRWNMEIINLLIKYGADVNKQDKDGKTALFYAHSSGNDDIVTALIKAGANTEIKDKQGRTYVEVERINIK